MTRHKAWVTMFIAAGLLVLTAALAFPKPAYADGLDLPGAIRDAASAPSTSPQIEAPIPLSQPDVPSPSLPSNPESGPAVQQVHQVIPKLDSLGPASSLPAAPPSMYP